MYEDQRTSEQDRRNYTVHVLHTCPLPGRLTLNKASRRHPPTHPPMRLKEID